MFMDNSIVLTLLRKKTSDISSAGMDFGRSNDMGTYSVQHSRLHRSYKQSAWLLLSLFLTFMFDIFNINPKQKEMPEAKLGFIITAWLAGLVGFSYTLLTVPWDDIKAVILLIIGTLWSLVNLCRAVVKLIKEAFDLKKHINQK